MRNLMCRIRKGLVGLLIAGAGFGTSSIAEEPKYGLAKILQEQGIEFVDKSNVRTYDADIPGARTIEEYLVDKSPYKIVHVRQVHQYGGKVSEEFLKDIHKNIYKILEYLIKSDVIGSLYVEGVTVEKENEINNR